jgi:ATP-dependent Zn protease
LNTEEIERTAIHEAGHAVCHLIYGFKLWRVEIFPKGRNIYYRTLFGNHLGRCSPSRSGWMRIPSSKWLEYARVGCAGYAAERLFYRTVDKEYAEDDFEGVARLIAEHGKAISIETIYDETMELLKQHRSAIRAIANELLASKRLSGARVKEIIQEREPKIHGSKVHTLSRR